MVTARALALISSILLLLASTTGLVAHDHHASEAPRGSECALDHHGAHHVPTSPRASLEHAGQPHIHDCVGCHFSGQRSQLGAGTLAFAAKVVLEGRLLAFEERPLSALLPSGRSLRGPPLA